MMLEGVNEAQRRAIEHDSGPALVVAGAGTGKTAVITLRIAELIKQGRAEPGEVLALTFTEKAAREMAERLYNLIGWHSFQVPVMTFNAFGAELLGRFAPHIGRSVRGGLINDVQKTLLLQQYFERTELSYYGPQADVFEFLEGVVEYIGRLQNAGISAQQYREYATELAKAPGALHPKDVAEQADLAILYDLYNQVKAETGTYDYNDQLELPLHILQQHPNLAERLGRQYRYVLVDEYQDTNVLQDRLLRSFIPPHGNLLVVGDDDQAIYGFRGAHLDNILSFSDHFKDVAPIVLTQNYRSGQAILDAAYRLIHHNDPERLEAKLGLDKRLVAVGQPLASIGFQPYASVTDEQESVLAEVERRLKAGEAPANIAVLASTHAALRPIAKGLRSRNLPFALSTSTNIFEQPEVNQLWYLLEWLAGRASDEAIAHVLLGRWFGWGPQDYHDFNREARDQLNTLEEALRASTDSAAKQVIASLDEWRGWSLTDSVSRLTYRLVFETGVSDTLIAAAPKSARIVRLFEDLHRWLEQMQDYETVAIDTALAGYLKAFPHPPTLEVREPLGEAEGVQLLSIHAAKGLEFDTVFIVNCTQRAWAGTARYQRYDVPETLRPDSLLPPEHELRRLMYVAVTRAKHEVILSAATATASGQRQSVSPFVTELLPDGLVGGIVTSETTELSRTLDKIQRFYPLQQHPADRLPFETSDGWIELGVGDLGSYEFCPYDFYLQKVIGISQPFGPQLAFGTALHAAIQRFYQAQLRGEKIDEAELRTHIDEQWSNRGYESQKLADQARELAYRALHNFCTREREQTERKVLGTELPIPLELPEAKLRLRGRIDAFFQTPDGIELRDFKTGRTQTDPDKLAAKAKSSFQLRTYALAYEVMTGTAPAAVTLDHIVTDTVGTAQLSATILKNHRAKLIQLAERIRSRDFAPQNTTMHTCASTRYFGTEDELDDLREDEDV
jgi:DNA helicase-2/ATP-dependent DNA helicase PcrA